MQWDQEQKTIEEYIVDHTRRREMREERKREGREYKLLVKNLPLASDEALVHKLFQRCGAIEDIEMLHTDQAVKNKRAQDAKAQREKSAREREGEEWKLHKRKVRATLREVRQQLGLKLLKQAGQLLESNSLSRLELEKIGKLCAEAFNDTVPHLGHQQGDIFVQAKVRKGDDPGEFDLAGQKRLEKEHRTDEALHGKLRAMQGKVRARMAQAAWLEEEIAVVMRYMAKPEKKSKNSAGSEEKEDEDKEDDDDAEEDEEYEDDVGDEYEDDAEDEDRQFDEFDEEDLDALELEVLVAREVRTRPPFALGPFTLRLAGTSAPPATFPASSHSAPHTHVSLQQKVHIPHHSTEVLPSPTVRSA